MKGELRSVEERKSNFGWIFFVGKRSQQAKLERGEPGLGAEKAFSDERGEERRLGVEVWEGER